MSFKVLVIPEDPTNNGYILKPLLKAILTDVNKPNANLQILPNPRLQGYDHAVRAIKNELLGKYGHWHLWLFIPDSDRAKSDAMDGLEAELKDKGVHLICSPAIPEVEIYACVAFRDEFGEKWNEARKSTRFKEEYFEPLIEKHGNKDAPGKGREKMTIEGLRKMETLYQLCPELKQLRDRIAAVV